MQQLCPLLTSCLRGLAPPSLVHVYGFVQPTVRGRTCRSTQPLVLAGCAASCTRYCARLAQIGRDSIASAFGGRLAARSCPREDTAVNSLHGCTIASSLHWDLDRRRGRDQAPGLRGSRWHPGSPVERGEAELDRKNYTQRPVPETKPARIGVDHFGAAHYHARASCRPARRSQVGSFVVHGRRPICDS